MCSPHDSGGQTPRGYNYTLTVNLWGTCLRVRGGLRVPAIKDRAIFVCLPLLGVAGKCESGPGPGGLEPGSRGGIGGRWRGGSA